MCFLSILILNLIQQNLARRIGLFVWRHYTVYAFSKIYGCMYKSNRTFVCSFDPVIAKLYKGLTLFMSNIVSNIIIPIMNSH